MTDLGHTPETHTQADADRHEGQAQGRIGGPITQTKPNAVEIRHTQAVAAMSQTHAALG